MCRQSHPTRRTWNELVSLKLTEVNRCVLSSTGENDDGADFNLWTKQIVYLSTVYSNLLQTFKKITQCRIQTYLFFYY